MKLSCQYCGDDYEYDHQKAGHPVMCRYCKRTFAMPALEHLSNDDRQAYSKEWNKKQEKIQKEKERIEENRRRERERKAAEERRRREQETRRQSLLLADLDPATPLPVPAKPRRGLAYYLDLRFERYLTPWIVRMTWLWTILATLLGIAIYAMVRLPAALPYEETVENDIPYAIRHEIAEIKTLIFQKELFADNRQRRPQQRDGREGAVPAQEAEQPSIERAQKPNYAVMTLEQLKAKLAKLEQQYPETTKQMNLNREGMFFYILSVAATVIGGILSLLALRVTCEFLIVIFNIATSISVIRDLIKAAKPDAQS